MSFPGNTLRTSQIDINGINLILNHFSCLDNRLGIISTELSNQRSIFRAGSKMLLFVIFGGSHYFRMKHGRVCQIGAIATAEQAEGQFRLIHHWSTY